MHNRYQYIKFYLRLKILPIGGLICLVSSPIDSDKSKSKNIVLKEHTNRFCVLSYGVCHVTNSYIAAECVHYLYFTDKYVNLHISSDALNLDTSILLDYTSYSEIDWRYIRYTLGKAVVYPIVVHNDIYDTLVRNLNMFDLSGLKSTFIMFLKYASYNISLISLSSNLFQILQLLVRSRNILNVYTTDMLDHVDDTDSSVEQLDLSELNDDDEYKAAVLSIEASNFALEQQLSVAGMLLHNQMYSISNMLVILNCSYLDLYKKYSMFICSCRTNIIELLHFIRCSIFLLCLQEQSNVSKVNITRSRSVYTYSISRTQRRYYSRCVNLKTKPKLIFVCLGLVFVLCIVIFFSIYAPFLECIYAETGKVTTALEGVIASFDADPLNVKSVASVFNENYVKTLRLVNTVSSDILNILLEGWVLIYLCVDAKIYGDSDSLMLYVRLLWQYISLFSDDIVLEKIAALDNVEKRRTCFIILRAVFELNVEMSEFLGFKPVIMPHDCSFNYPFYCIISTPDTNFDILIAEIESAVTYCEDEVCDKGDSQDIKGWISLLKQIIHLFSSVKMLNILNKRDNKSEKCRKLILKVFDLLVLLYKYNKKKK